MNVLSLKTEDEQIQPNIFPSPFIQLPTPLLAKIECKPFIQKLLLQIVDCPGVEISADMYKKGQSISRQTEFAARRYLDMLIKFIEAQFDKTLTDESKVKRIKIPDYHIHACLYFLSPDVIIAAKGLTAQDKLILPKLALTVNVILCLGKSVYYSLRRIQ